MSEESKVDFCGVFCNRGAELAALRAENEKFAQHNKALKEHQEKLLELNAEMLAMLERMSLNERCPCCDNVVGHSDFCTLSALIKKAGAL